MNIRWVVQANLLAEKDIDLLRSACEAIGAEFQPVVVIPFSEDVPDFTLDQKTNIYYGSISFINRVNAALKSPLGIFFDDEVFRMDNYIARWGDHMLNSDARVTTLADFASKDHSNDSDWFIRPNADDKSFDGEVMSFGKIVEWVSRVASVAEIEASLGHISTLNSNTKILAGPAYRVEKEWRNYIVDGKVVASTLYRTEHRLSKAIGAPKEVVDFVHARCSEYVPNRVFVMDVALCNGVFYIVECGCLNSVGFYDADVNAIVKTVSNAIIQ